MANIVVTIGREYGSGGHEIGEKLAKELGFSFYDKELLKIVSEKSGIQEQVLQKADEVTSNPLFAPYYPPSIDPGSLNDRLFKMQSDLIREKADAENCVIVGRCANYVLEDRENVIRVFIYADIEKRINRIMSRHGIADRDVAIKLIKKTDKNRRSYYQFYSEMKWGRTEGQDIMINSGLLGIDGTVALLKTLVEKKMAEQA
jgi:cytidylate kinase